MDLPPEFLAARGYLEVARGDCAKGFYLSACMTAQKAAEVALQSYLALQGMDARAESLPLLLACVPRRSATLERAGHELERFRVDMGSPYRSASGPDPEATGEAADLCCEAARAIVDHVARLFAGLEEEGR